MGQIPLGAQNMWFIYIVECSDGSYYTGITNDIERRIEEHNVGNIGSKYIRTRRPVKLVYRQTTKTRSEALKREAEIKRLSRQAKELLVGPVAQR